ncbi:L-rhamnose mutarotase [Streptacidiphilus sp. EB103A]|jgi:L-rhamnose mutarotase|uniref:L-rhamnose mutarotase n=1 Tax=Streptacidiphilus sp. EB103A TaxID=3156275 RepID=UPI003517ACC7
MTPTPSQEPLHDTKPETVVLRTRLREGMEEAYEDFHRTVPPAVAKDLSDRGVTEWRIWRSGHDLFHLVEVADYAAFVAGDTDNPVSIAWQASVAPYLEMTNTPQDPEGNTLRLVWDLSSNTARSRET